MNAKEKLDLIMQIRSKILDTTNIKDIQYAEEIARRWVGRLS